LSAARTDQTVDFYGILIPHNIGQKRIYFWCKASLPQKITCWSGAIKPRMIARMANALEGVRLHKSRIPSKAPRKPRIRMVRRISVKRGPRY
jgi:hypothetical protein